MIKHLRRQAFFEYVREETFGKFGLQQIQVPRWVKPRWHFHGAKPEMFDCSDTTKQWPEPCLGGGFKYFYFHPYLGKIPILTNIFQMGWNHQPVAYAFAVYRGWCYPSI